MDCSPIPGFITPGLHQNLHIDTIEEDIKFEILSFLDLKGLTHGINLASKTWCTLSKKNAVWKPRLKKEFPDSFARYERIIKEKKIEPQFKDVYSKVTLWWKRILGAEINCTTLNWNTEHPTDLAFTSPFVFSDNQIITACSDDAIRFWNLENHQCVKILSNVHTDHVKQLLLHHNTIISGSRDHSIGIWSAQDGSCKKLLGHTGKIRSMKMYEELLVSCAEKDAVIRVWNLSPGKLVKKLEDSCANDDMRCLDISGHTLVTGGFSGMLYVWDLKTGNYQYLIEKHASAVTQVKIIGDFVVSSSFDKTLQIWNLKTKQHVASLEGHDGEVEQFDVINDKLISASTDSTMRIWDLKKPKESIKLENHRQAITSFTVFDHKIISGSLDETICIWDLKTGELLRTLDRCLESNYPESIQVIDDKIVLGTPTGLVILT